MSMSTVISVTELAFFRLDEINRLLKSIDNKIDKGVPPGSIRNETTIIGRHVRHLRKEIGRARPHDEWFNNNPWLTKPVDAPITDEEVKSMQRVILEAREAVRPIVEREAQAEQRTPEDIKLREDQR